MALTPCKECKAEISSEAKTCPRCGAKQPGGTSLLTLAFAIIVVAFVLKAALTSSDTPVPAVVSAEEKAEADRKEKDFQTVLAGAKWLKDSMKKPETFELLDASMIDSKVICFQYKARNSWNDVAKGYHVITDNLNSGEASAWNKHCANKSGVDYTYARTALN